MLEKKRSVGAKLFIFFLFIIFIINNHAVALSEETDEIIFEERLSKTLIYGKEIAEMPSSTSADLEKLTKIYDELRNFAVDFPNSKFADDAQFLYIIPVFIGAVVDQNKEEAQKYIENMQEVVTRYPNGKLEEFACLKWKEVLGPSSSGEIDIPYKYIVAYMRGFMGFEFEDYESTINNFSLFKDKLNYSKDSSGLLAEKIYLPLAISYKRLGRLDECNKIAKEAIDKFSDNERLRQFMEQIIAKTSSPVPK